jgi:hypothetical protein
MKTAWSKDFSKAPKDRPFLLRDEHMVCPVVVQWWDEADSEDDLPGWSGYVYVEPLISDVEGGVTLGELADPEWVDIPT